MKPSRKSRKSEIAATPFQARDAVSAYHHFMAEATRMPDPETCRIAGTSIWS